MGRARTIEALCARVEARPRPCGLAALGKSQQASIPGPVPVLLGISLRTSSLLRTLSVREHIPPPGRKRSLSASGGRAADPGRRRNEPRYRWAGADYRPGNSPRSSPHRIAISLVDTQFRRAHRRISDKPAAHVGARADRGGTHLAESAKLVLAHAALVAHSWAISSASRSGVRACRSARAAQGHSGDPREPDAPLSRSSWGRAGPMR